MVAAIEAKETSDGTVQGGRIQHGEVDVLGDAVLEVLSHLAEEKLVTGRPGGVCDRNYTCIMQ